MSHTHAGANVNSQLTDKPGGELIQPYIEHLTEQIGDAIVEARAALAPAWVTYGDGRCALATNRDLWDAEAERFACGYNPDAARRRHAAGREGHGRGRRAARDAVQLRLPSDDARLGRTGCCRPTTSARRARCSERAFGAPALFLQGASGDLAPRDDYVGDTAVADRNGRQLGYAAAAAIESLPPPGTRFVYTGIVASGANLGTWEYQPCDAEQLRASEQLAARVSHVELRRKEDIGVVESLSGATPDSVQEREKALRRRFLAQALGDGPVHDDAALDLAARRRAARRGSQRALLGVPGRAAATLRRDARCSCSAMTNRTMGYLSPEETYGTGLYQEQQSPFAPGCLEQTIEVAAPTLAELRREGQ